MPAAICSAKLAFLAVVAKHGQAIGRIVLGQFSQDRRVDGGHAAHQPAVHEGRHVGERSAGLLPDEHDASGSTL